MAAAGATARKQERRTRGEGPRLRAALAVCVAAIALVGLAAARWQRDAARQAERDELSAIADLKIRQLVAWREERLRDATAIGCSRLTAEAVAALLRDPPTPSARASLTDLLHRLTEPDQAYRRAWLFDRQARVVLTAPSAPTPPGPCLLAMARSGLAAQAPFLGDLHTGDDPATVHLDLVCPVPGPRGTVQAVIVLQIDPHEFLYPLVQSWPTKSATAETVLARREGEEVVFLNELRHRSGTALTLRFPLSHPDLPAARALRGETGVSEGRDYREVPVLAAAQRVPDSPWVLVAKVDLREVYGPLRVRLALVLAVMLGAMLSTVGAVAFVLRGRQAALAERLALLTRHAKDIVILVDDEWRIIEANDAAVTAYGYPLSELRGRPVADLRAPESRTAFTAESQRLMDEGDLLIESVHQRRDGTPFPVEVSARVVEIDGLPRKLAVIRDVSERRQAEAAERHRAELFDAMFRQSAVGVALVEARTGRFRRVNERYAEIVGRPVEELLATTYMAITHPGDLPADDQQMARLLAGEISAYTMEKRYVRPDGRPAWAHLAVSALWAPGAQPTEQVGIIADITEGKLAELSLRAREAELHRAQAVAHVGSWTLDVVSGKLEWSAETYRMFGVAPGTPESYDSFIAAVHPDDRAMVEAAWQAALDGAEYDLEHRISVAGETRWVRERAELERDADGRPRAALGTVQDITDRHQAEHERLRLERQILESQKLESLGMLAGGIAHDFNNLLTSMMGNATLALDELPPGVPGREHLHEIEEASRRAADLCRQMLAYAGKGRFVVENLDLSAVVENMVHLLRTSISKKVVLNLHLAKDLPLVRGDGTQLRQIVMNLVLNAAEAIGERSGTVTITTTRRECSAEYLRQTIGDHDLAPGPYIALEVADTGCGMDEETQRRLFEPFFTTKFTGRGLGLAAALGIVRGHGGALRVYSELGRGTTFRVLLPVAAALEQTSPGPASAPPEPVAAGGTVLLVDDEEAIRSLARRMLERLGYHVLEAANGREALDAYNSHDGVIDLVLLDLTMPKMDGEETFRELRQLNPDVRVLMASGYTEADVTARFAGKGLAAFIEKPYTLDLLRRKLAEALER